MPAESMDAVEEMGGFVLAGGESSRMGRPKALLEIAGMPMLTRTARLIESVADSCAVIGPRDELKCVHPRVIGDEFPGCGPLGGIATALDASLAPWNLVVACDLPYLTKSWLAYLVMRALASRAGAVIPMNERGAEPLCAMYHKRGAAAIRSALRGGVRKVTDGLAALTIEHIEPSEWKPFDSEGLLFKNVNSPEDYEDAKRRLGDRANS